MPWVRFDDQATIHRKVSGLSDAAFRLHFSAIFWCARNLTDGAVPEEDLDDVCARVRTPGRFVAELLKRGLWHEADQGCDSPDCPTYPDNAVTHGAGDGWVIHDYLEYQPSKARVEHDRQANAARQKKWRDQQKEDGAKRNAVSNGRRNGVSNGRRNGVSNGAPSRPDPKGRSPVGESPAGRNARTREDDEITQAIIGILTGQTGKPITAEWADKIRRQILTGRTPDNPTAYIAACIRAAPRDYLPTSDQHPSSRTVAEALTTARGGTP